jgi:anthranilate phosphoribosyltransferase
VNGFPALLRDTIAGRDLSADAVAEAIGAIMDETLTGVRAAAFLVALATKGETVAEVVGAARAMRDRSVHVDHGLPLVIDVCGTGGDGSGSINISTAAMFVVAGAGVPVAKHGNRAASSLSGSADVLEELGVPLDRSAEENAALLRRSHIAFLFAQRYHPAMRAVGPIRRELGVRTVFNVLGPLTNPAAATRQVVGVAHAAAVELVGNALCELGSDAAAVVHARSGLDEIAGDAPTDVFAFDRRGVRRYTIDPGDYGVRASADEIRGGDATFNALALLEILRGERSARADLVCLNAALALVVAEAADDLREGLERARGAIASGAASDALDALRGDRARQLVS